MKILLAIFTSFLLLGCTNNSTPAQLVNIPLAAKPAIPNTEKECTDAKAYWVEQGIPGGGKSCAIKTKDSRKICTEDLQCEGSCLVASSTKVGSPAIGSCSDWVATYGCYNFIQDGLVRNICTD